MQNTNTIIAKPFLKWAGGKTQLISEIDKVLPNLVQNEPFNFIEPFVGSGAVLFWMIEKFPNLKKAVINDVNRDLTDCYDTIKKDVNSLIGILLCWENEYHRISEDLETKKKYFYNKREQFNSRKTDMLTQSALFIFLNRTCFNGLYRVNSQNKFNVPIGSYRRPQICNIDNLIAVSQALQKVEILNGDYTKTLKHANNNTFFYFDPPYKPLSETSSFNSYAKGAFNDAEQIRLKDFCEELNKIGHKWILSNSDMKNVNPDDNFFDDMYANFNIQRVNANRRINSKASKRGNLTELLIRN